MEQWLCGLILTLILMYYIILFWCIWVSLKFSHVLNKLLQGSSESNTLVWFVVRLPLSHLSKWNFKNQKK